MLFSTLNTHIEKNQDEESEPLEHYKIREENSKQPQPVLFILEKLLEIFKSLGTNWEVTEQITEVIKTYKFFIFKKN